MCIRDSARIAQVIATGTTAIGFGLAWGGLFPDRPALQQLASSSQRGDWQGKTAAEAIADADISDAEDLYYATPPNGESLLRNSIFVATCGYWRAEAPQDGHRQGVLYLGVSIGRAGQQQDNARHDNG